MIELLQTAVITLSIGENGDVSLKFLAERGSDSCRGAHCRLRIWSDILINLEKYSTYLIIYRLTARCKVFCQKYF